MEPGITLKTRTSLFNASRTRQGHRTRTDPADDPKTILAAHSAREESIDSAERIHFPVAAPDNEGAREGAERGRGGRRPFIMGKYLPGENECRNSIA